MGVRTIKLDLDICKKNYLTVDTVKSLDSIIFKISIFENGISKDMTRQTVALYCKRKNNTVVEQKDNISVSNNLITINVKNSCFQVPGTALFELELKDSSGTIATMNFTINVEARLNSSEVISASNEISGLNAVVKNLENKAQQLDNTIIDVNTKLNATLSSLQTKANANVDLIITTANNNINTSINAINASGTKAINAINASGTKAINAINTSGTKAISDIKENYNSLKKVIIDSSASAVLQEQINNCVKSNQITSDNDIDNILNKYLGGLI